MTQYEDFADEDAAEVQQQGSSSPFLPLAGLLVSILVLTAIFAGIIWLVRGGVLDGGDGEQDQAFNATSTAVAIANATTLAQNAGVTATLLSMTEEASRPTATDTPEPPPPTDQPSTLPTAGPIETPVVIDAGESGGSGVEEGTSVGDSGGLGGTTTAVSGTDGSTDAGASGTETAGAGAGGTGSTGTGAGGTGSAGTGSGGTGSASTGSASTGSAGAGAGGTGAGGTGTDGTLPDTGFGLAQAVAIAFGLVLVFVIARRLRTS